MSERPATRRTRRALVGAAWALAWTLAWGGALAMFAHRTEAAVSSAPLQRVAPGAVGLVR